MEDLEVSSESVKNAMIPLKRVSMNNQECRVKATIVDINNNESLFCSHNVTVYKCINNCNTINDQYAQVCVSNVVKDMNIKVFNWMSITNKTRYMSWHKTSTCKCRLNSSAFNDKQR